MSHRLALRDLIDVVRPARPVASVYLGSSPLRSWRGRWLRLADQLRADGADPDLVDTIGEVLDRARSHYPTADTLVAFAGEELPPRVFHTPGLRHLDLAWFSSPAHVLPLLAWLQDRPPRVAVTAGRCSADLLAGNEHISLNYPESQWLEGVRSAAVACAEMLVRQEARLLVVTGEDEVVGALWEALPAPVRRDVVVRWSGRALTPGRIQAETRAAARSWTEGVLADFNERGRLRRLAVEGADDTLNALSTGRLDDLLVGFPEDITATAWYGANPTDVARGWSPARRCGLLADVAVRAALLSGTRVHVIAAGLPSAPFENIGGLCRAQLALVRS
ncbi:hypothetical protein G7043_46450 [Lentzea sp. NEAU-D13]|uniref:Uncharacterized protein n=1 Tax=Lentzea alba TaxID=2714351 RepID=A0A7C9VWB3_9PSEU|nr:hypothetical protein [Lentzea alba]NGY66354.1 hypothetical protein [Lentzea alba]